MILYHHTNEQALNGIKKKGLLPFGLNWFTSNADSENTVNFHGRANQARISINITEDIKKFSEYKVKEYEMLSCYTNIEMIDLITNTDFWYYTERIIEPIEILKYEVLINGEWNVSELPTMQ